jgi:hypothetical protein
MLRAAAIAARTDRRSKLRTGLRAASLAGALVAALALRVYWAFLLPFNDAPDEFCHYPMAAYLAEHGRPPTMADVPHTIPVSYPAMSPLGYVPSALATAAFGVDHPWSYLAARLANALLGAATVGLFFLAVRTLTPGWPAPAHAAAWLAALHPQLIFISAYVNNDAAMLLVVAALWIAWFRLARCEERSGTLAWWGAAGALAGLAVLCKPNAAGVVLAGAPVAALQVARGLRRRDASLGFFGPLAAAAAAAAVCLPWCAWNVRRHGSWFGLDVHREWWLEHTRAAGVRQGCLTLDNLGDFLAGTWESFWGCFGYATARLPRSDYILVSLAVGTAAGALAARFDDPRLSAGWSGEGRRRAAWAAAAAGFLFTWLAHAYHSANFGMSAQGRYILPAALPVVAACAVGASLLGTGWRRGWFAFVLVAVFAWVEWSAVDVEQFSNRIPQPDRRVRARLHSLQMDLPGIQKYRGGAPELVGDGGVARGEEGWRIDAAAGAFVRLGPPAPASSLGGVLIEQRWLAGSDRDGMLRLRSLESPGEILARIPYRDARTGLCSYRFDLRKVRRLLGDRMVQVEIVLAEGDAAVEWRGAEWLGVDLRTPVGPPPTQIAERPDRSTGSLAADPRQRPVERIADRTDGRKIKE